MSAFAIVIIALAMSTDAFAAAIAKGAKMRNPTWPQALKTGALFGAIEAITPLIGWLIGSVAVNWAAQWDHWIAFTVLAALGLHMIYEGAQPPETEAGGSPAAQPSLGAMAITAIATSIDALAVGVGLAFVEVSILVAAGAIGLATFSMVTLGVMVGRAVGAIAGKKSEVLGGLVLIAVGGSILFDHLSHGH